MFFRSTELSPFRLRTTPDAAELGKALDQPSSRCEARIHFCYGEAVASEHVADLWSACCELMLQAQLIRDKELTHFVLDVEQIFEVSYQGDVLFCRYSPEHVFAVSRSEFVSSIEYLIDDLSQATAFPRLTRIAVQRGSAAIRALPYFHRFSAV